MPEVRCARAASERPRTLCLTVSRVAPGVVVRPSLQTPQKMSRSRVAAMQEPDQADRAPDMLQWRVCCDDVTRVSRLTSLQATASFDQFMLWNRDTEVGSRERVRRALSEWPLLAAAVRLSGGVYKWPPRLNLHAHWSRRFTTQWNRSEQCGTWTPVPTHRD